MLSVARAAWETKKRKKRQKHVALSSVCDSGEINQYKPHEVSALSDVCDLGVFFKKTSLKKLN